MRVRAHHESAACAAPDTYPSAGLSDLAGIGGASMRHVASQRRSTAARRYAGSEVRCELAGEAARPEPLRALVSSSMLILSGAFRDTRAAFGARGQLTLEFGAGSRVYSG